jgi:uncharacterized protein (DUF885 family)
MPRPTFSARAGWRFYCRPASPAHTGRLSPPEPAPILTRRTAVNGATIPENRRMKHFASRAFAVIVALTAFSAGPGLAQAAAGIDTLPTRSDLVAALADSIAAVRRGGEPLPVPPGVDPRYFARLNSVSLDAFAEELSALERIRELSRRIDRLGLERSDALDLEILDLQLQNRVAELRYRGYLLPLGSRSGFHFNFAGLPERSEFATVEDYDRYIARMQSFLEHTRQQIELLREGIRTGMVMPRAVLDGYEETAAQHVTADPWESPFAEPLERVPTGFSSSDRERIRRDGLDAIRESVIPAFAELAAFFVEEYIPAARSELGVVALPDGRAYYEHRVRMYTTLEISPEEVHAIGRDLVASIRREMDGIREEVGFDGDHDAFVEHLRTHPRFSVATENEYLALVSHAAKLMDGHAPRLFSRLPRTPYGVRPMPAHVAARQSAGYYDRGNPDGSRAGWVNINTSMLPSRPTWAARALAFHEGMPGHHLQIMLALEDEALSAVRRNASITVFVEGWGLYAERLGLDVGLYDDPYDRFGMWSYQIWRACRLVVDTGMHALGWSRGEAIDFMARNTGMTVEAVTAEIDRHITEPGQGLAYTMGELVISELRREAEERLGEDFDIRRFHDAVLRNGTLSLPLLRAEVTAWIDASAARNR